MKGQARAPRGGGRGARHRETPPQLLSNLQSLLIHGSPVVRMDGFFTLADLWQSYEAWSAYGCEVPMRVQVDGVWQEIIQCYTPYLSGIQLFGADHTRRIRPARAPSSSSTAASSYCSEAEEEDEEGGSDSADESVGSGASDAASCTSSAYTCSTASTASDSEDGEGEEACCKGSPTCVVAAGGAGGAPAAARRLARAAERGSVLQKQHTLGEPTQPLFEYHEVERPHLRAPLHDVVMELAERFPALLTLDTRDLHPTSWFAVTWVPIYRIPSIPDPAISRDLQANFLTFHSLSVPTPRLHAAPQDFCSIAPLPPLLDPIGAAAVAWRTEVARQQLVSNALSAFSAAHAQQQQAAAAAAAAAAVQQHQQQAAAPSSPSITSSSGVSTPSAAASPVAALAAQLSGPAGLDRAAVAQLPLAATCLRPFAFMPYKVSGRTWVDDWNLNRQHLPMIAAAGSWIERRKVQLPDFDFMSQMYRPLPTSHYGGR